MPKSVSKSLQRAKKEGVSSTGLAAENYYNRMMDELEKEDKTPRKRSTKTVPAHSTFPGVKVNMDLLKARRQQDKRVVSETPIVEEKHPAVTAAQARKAARNGAAKKSASKRASSEKKGRGRPAKEISALPAKAELAKLANTPLAAIQHDAGTLMVVLSGTNYICLNKPSKGEISQVSSPIVKGNVRTYRKAIRTILKEHFKLYPPPK